MILKDLLGVNLYAKKLRLCRLVQGLPKREGFKMYEPCLETEHATEENLKPFIDYEVSSIISEQYRILTIYIKPLDDQKSVFIE